MKTLLFLVAMLTVVGCGSKVYSSSDVEAVEIARGEHLQDRTLTEQMFASMREGGVSPEQPLLWGYFFYGIKRDWTKFGALWMARVTNLYDWKKLKMNRPIFFMSRKSSSIPSIHC